jgi:alkylation response protein AidB-like acyl-CoA dehydrogenase
VIDRNGLDAALALAAPGLGNQYRADPLLRSWLRRALPTAVLAALDPELDELGAVAAGDLYELQLADRRSEPRLTQLDSRGGRIDQVQVTPLWHEAERLAVRHGLVATAYERQRGRHARIEQFARVYLFHPSSDFYTCALAMTDGAARTLSESGGQPLRDRALPRLTARDPAQFWTAGQWTTEPESRGDAGRGRMRAEADGDQWRLYGRTCSTALVSSQVALALARPEGHAADGDGLALYYVELRDADGRLNGWRVDRLQDKLGARKVPTAGIALDGTRATLVGRPMDGTRALEPMSSVTSTWSSVCAAAAMRRSLALARSHAASSEFLGQPIAALPLSRDTLAALEAETWGAFLVSFLVVELQGRLDSGEIDAQQRALLRLVAPLAKLVTARQVVAVASEVIEGCGVAGQIEDTGLPQLLRDSQMLPNWDRPTNCVALDALLQADPHTGLAALMGRASACLRAIKEPRLAAAGRQAVGALERAALWLESGKDRDVLEAGARRLAMTLARGLQLALLCEHAQWMLDRGGDRRGFAAALRYSRLPVDLMHEVDPELDRQLLS